eukprot:GHVT01098052.1.p1 GENE.GHVT01098052.1~~GHVT01098052.1.p1  ORF type:complete len:268 (+),score=50.65 GHVT01098052.1:681-1484(+)
MSPHFSFSVSGFPGPRVLGCCLLLLAVLPSLLQGPCVAVAFRLSRDPSAPSASPPSGSAPSSSMSSSPSDISCCRFFTGESSRDGSLHPFYVPSRDESLYSRGVKEYMATVGVDTSSLSVSCEKLTRAEAMSRQVVCQLCLYHEVSGDKKHVRQGQVLESPLLECMEGNFNGMATPPGRGTAESKSLLSRMQANKNADPKTTAAAVAAIAQGEYHPICYPPPTNVSQLPTPAVAEQPQLTAKALGNANRSDAANAQAVDAQVKQHDL